MIKGAGAWGSYSTPFSIQVMNDRSRTSVPPYIFMFITVVGSNHETVWVKSVNTVAQAAVPLMQSCTNFPKIWGHLKRSLGPRKVTWSKSHTEVPQTLDITITNLVLRATWCPWRLCPCFDAFYIINVFTNERCHYSILVAAVHWNSKRLFCV